MQLGSWLDQADVERGNDDALIGVVVHKRWSKGAAGEQFVTMTAESFAVLLEAGLTRDDDDEWGTDA